MTGSHAWVKLTIGVIEKTTGSKRFNFKILGFHKPSLWANLPAYKMCIDMYSLAWYTLYAAIVISIVIKAEWQLYDKTPISDCTNDLLLETLKINLSTMVCMALVMYWLGLEVSCSRMYIHYDNMTSKVAVSFLCMLFGQWATTHPLKCMTPLSWPRNRSTEFPFPERIKFSFYSRTEWLGKPCTWYMKSVKWHECVTEWHTSYQHVWSCPALAFLILGIQ